MLVPVAFHPPAAAEIDRAYTWYQNVRVGLGDEFLGCIDAMVSRVARGPADYPMVYPEVRRALVHRFPYAMFYLVEPGRVVVLAVLHVRQDSSAVAARAVDEEDG